MGRIMNCKKCREKFFISDSDSQERKDTQLCKKCYAEKLELENIEQELQED